MTKKRFILDDDGIITDMFDLSMYMDNEDCCEKLNELHKDVERQREFKFSAIRQANRIDKENEQLKERLKLVRKDLTHIMLLLLNDEIVKQLSDYDIKVFERLSKV